MKISGIIIDHKEKDRKKLKKLVTRNEMLTISGAYALGEEAMKHIEKTKPDVVILDVKIPDVNVFDMIKKLSKSINPIFIIVTENEEYALKAFEHNVFDYFVKPINENRFSKTLDKVVKQIRKEEIFKFNDNLENMLDFLSIKKKTTSNLSDRKITIKTGNRIIFLDINSIKYISASGYYIEIFTSDNKKFVLRESLSSIKTRLNSDVFIRIHRSTIINSDYIHEIITSNFGETDVKINDNKTFRVSKGYKKEFQEIIGVK